MYLIECPYCGEKNPHDPGKTAGFFKLVRLYRSLFSGRTRTMECEECGRTFLFVVVLTPVFRLPDDTVVRAGDETVVRPREKVLDGALRLRIKTLFLRTTARLFGARCPYCGDIVPVPKEPLVPWKTEELRCTYRNTSAGGLVRTDCPGCDAVMSFRFRVGITVIPIPQREIDVYPSVRLSGCNP